MLPQHINPDHYLDAAGPVDSPERGKAAWALAYAALEERLKAVGAAGTLYVVCGLQGAGKSTWVEHNAARLGELAVFFDAALPSRKHRARSLGLAAATGTRAIAVWINVPIGVALQRNAARSGAARIDEHIIHHVLEQLEAPSVEEGFAEVIEVTA